jgi:hypothetical protein
MNLFGRSWTRKELEARVGQLGQIGGIRRMKLVEGKEAGTELIRVRTGSGLSFDVVPSKGLDISLAELWGTPISWQSPNGDVHPSYYEPEQTGWIRTASGGLLMTCGLSHVGSPSDDEREHHGLHGRVHHTPAKHISIQENWSSDDLEWSISGVVEETAIFRSQLRMTRKISGKLGENKINICDRVENLGFRPATHMMLYHFNFGFPLLGEQTTVHFPPADSEPREAGVPLTYCSNWEKPDPHCEEKVYYHTLRPHASDHFGMAEVQIFNPLFPVGGQLRPTKVRLRWSADTLPILVQWRMPGEGEHALGLEPANCRVEGRVAERERGALHLLEAKQSLDYNIELILE